MTTPSSNGGRTSKFADRAATAFTPPATLKEGDERKLYLLDLINGINLQLGDRTREAANGVKYENSDYWAWRQKAVYAKQSAEAELRHLNLWLKEQLAVVRPKSPIRKAWISYG